MARKPNIVPTVKLNMALPIDVRARIDAILYSEAEGRVPLGGYQTFFLSLVRWFFDTAELDLAPFFGTEPGVHVVRGRAFTIKMLKHTLTQDTRK